ncbi:hypothetical protein [Streptomyces sp. NPDC088146]|uniref:hypothetical protein n=1 Tax=Streptomyces sp. NPDC088146 TaxID=3365829 RepID=UPI0038197DF1
MARPSSSLAPDSAGRRRASASDCGDRSTPASCLPSLRDRSSSSRPSPQPRSSTCLLPATPVRHNALAAVEEAGPSGARTEVLRALARDPDLGTAAARILTAWGRKPDA